MQDLKKRRMGKTDREHDVHQYCC